MDQLRILVLAAIALLCACATVDRDVRAEQRSIRYCDLPADLKKVLGWIREDSILILDAVPWESCWTPWGQDGQIRLVNGLPISEACLVVSWGISPDADWRSGGQFVVDGREGEWHIKGIMIPCIPLGNWRTVWMGDAPMPPDYRPK